MAKVRRPQVGTECAECFEAATRYHGLTPLCELHWRVHDNLDKKYDEAGDDEAAQDRVLVAFGYDIEDEEAA
jgi:hypothetical protein